MRLGFELDGLAVVISASETDAFLKEVLGDADIRAEVPLAEMFGYATDLRSMSQGRAVYSMEFQKYAEVPQNVADVVMKKAS